MNVDEIDIRMIVTIYLKKFMSSTQLAESIFEIKDRKERVDRDSYVRRRLKKLHRYGILDLRVEDGKRIYCLKKGATMIGVKVEKYTMYFPMM